ncbi:hypothetical protein CPB84DRAFT_1398194 [Gymnopilus junonius]|uniref:Uncharacterized protein n=1 Tax=Gymnopilus junonius TaxID=109634 RepID=A0A9P5NJJ8_GYMJU|nr:hypothetical protein CPB84DRAFT_1398194 [Gymnopilus junonius]
MSLTMLGWMTELFTWLLERLAEGAMSWVRTSGGCARMEDVVCGCLWILKRSSAVPTRLAGWLGCAGCGVMDIGRDASPCSSGSSCEVCPAASSCLLRPLTLQSELTEDIAEWLQLYNTSKRYSRGWFRDRHVLSLHSINIFPRVTFENKPFNNIIASGIRTTYEPKNPKESQKPIKVK